MNALRSVGRGLDPAKGLVWLVLLAFPVTATLDAHPPPAELVATLLGAALFVGAYLRVALRGAQTLADAQGLAWVGLLLALATALALGDRAAWAVLFVFAAAAAGASMRERPAALAVAFCVLLAALATIAAGAGVVACVASAGATAGIGLLVLSMSGLRVRNAELQGAREELARLAVAGERLRFARDLHDLLGHSLSVIALKAELAGRLLDGATVGDAENGASPRGVRARAGALADGELVAAARTHIGELEGVARGALSEVREAVSGYRRPLLAAELDGARMALDAAGIEARLDRAPRALAPDVEALLAWTVREGTINAIRHSGARSCRIAIAASAQAASVEVIDDGRGPAGANGGHGLAGLRERTERLAGHMEAGSAAGRGFRLRVSVPSETPPGAGAA